MNLSSNIYVVGHRGLVGSAIARNLQEKRHDNLVTRTSSDLDLRNAAATDAFFAEARPEYVLLAAAKVGGIVANDTYRGEFLYDNLMIQNNVIESARRHGVKKLLFLGSTCIYPRECPQPMIEEYLLTAPLEYTNEPYAIAKLHGLKRRSVEGDGRFGGLGADHGVIGKTRCVTRFRIHPEQTLPKYSKRGPIHPI